MRKYSIMPQISVYKDMFDIKEIERFLLLAKKSRDADQTKSNFVSAEDATYADVHGDLSLELDDNSIFNTWVQWHEFGNKTFINRKEILSNEKDPDLIFLSEFRRKIFDAIDTIYLDYVEEWGEKGEWPDFPAGDWVINAPYKKVISQNPTLHYGQLELLAHYIYPDKQDAITLHTDSHPHRYGQPRNQQMLTITIYLNDDYVGGEVEFLSNNEDKLITYKPAPGDITIFPGAAPYWHAAKAVTSGNNKFFFRLFFLWQDPGSKEWHEGVKEHGEEKWMKMFEKSMDDFIQAGNVSKTVHIPGKNRIKINPSLDLYITPENDIYIDGRTI